MTESFRTKSHAQRLPRSSRTMRRIVFPGKRGSVTANLLLRCSRLGLGASRVESALDRLRAENSQMMLDTVEKALAMLKYT